MRLLRAASDRRLGVISHALANVRACAEAKLPSLRYRCAVVRAPVSPALRSANFGTLPLKFLRRELAHLWNTRFSIAPGFLGLLRKEG